MRRKSTAFFSIIGPLNLVHFTNMKISMAGSADSEKNQVVPKMSPGSIEPAVDEMVVHV